MTKPILMLPRLTRRQLGLSTRSYLLVVYIFFLLLHYSAILVAEGFAIPQLSQSLLHDKNYGLPPMPTTSSTRRNHLGSVERVQVSCFVSGSSTSNTVLCASSKNNNDDEITTIQTNVLVVGGSGRVGGSTVRWLQEYSNRDPDLELTVKVGGRSAESFETAKDNGVIPNNSSTNGNTDDIEFVPLDWIQWDTAKISETLANCGCGLVVHTAGPFQGQTENSLLEACVRQKIPYVDVCDEFELASNAKTSWHETAQNEGVKAVVCGGIWPGVSALMASNAVETYQTKYAGEKPENLDFSFFTAGTGNAGPTIVSATFLLLATPVLTFCKGKKAEIEPWTDPRNVDFGPAVGTRPVWLLDNPDVPTTALALKIPNVSSRFSTAPLIWNYLFGAMKAIPRNILYNRDLMQKFALFSEPIIRFVDKLVGATNAMRVDVTGGTNNQNKVTCQIVHDDLEMCVGLATAAFAIEVSKEKTTIPNGVWYPSELPPEARSNILEAAREGTITYNV